MTNIIHPEQDAPVNRMDLHRDIVWVIRSLWGGGIAFTMLIAWAVSLASDVERNTADLKSKADSTASLSVAASLVRIENKIDSADTRQRQMSVDIAKLTEQVEDLEEEQTN